MREIPYGDTVPGATSNGFPQAELSLEPPAFSPAGDDLGLTLARDPAEPPPKRHKPLPRRPLIMAAWAVVLGGALSVAYVTQPTRQLTGDTDLPPAVAPAAADELGAPVTAPPIAAQPERFTQASSAPEINPPAPADDPQPGELRIAQAAPPPAPAETAAIPPAPPLPAKPAAIQTSAATPKASAKLEKVSAAPKAEVSEQADAKPLKAVKAEKASDKPKPARLEKVSATDKASEKVDAKTLKPEKAGKAKTADATDLPQLKARLNHAYAEAVKAGTPKTVLKARQTEWQALRAKAEKKGPAAVAALYRTRAAQLEAIAKKTARNRSRAEAAPV